MSRSFDARRTHGSVAELVGGPVKRQERFICPECKTKTFRTHGAQIYCRPCSSNRMVERQSRRQSRNYQRARQSKPPVVRAPKRIRYTKEQAQDVVTMLRDGMAVEVVCAKMSITRDDVTKILKRRRSP